MSDLHDLLSPELILSLEDFVDQRVAAALAGRENGSEPAWLTIQEAAARVRVSERTVEREIQKSHIRTSTIGRRRLIHRDDLDRFADEGDGGGKRQATRPRRQRPTLDADRDEA